MDTVIQYTQRGNDERNQRWDRVEVAYLALADNVPGPLPSHLRRLTQLVLSPPNRFSTPRLSRLACI